MIVLEGPDGGGKSTLASVLAHMTKWPIIGSEGPPKGTIEFIERLERYHALPTTVICDRHPVISDPIYAKAFGRDTFVRYEDLFRFLNRNTFIVYCVSPTGELGPQDNPHADTPEYVSQLTREHANIRKLYEWHFTRHPPHAVYRWDQPFPRELLIHLARVNAHASTVLA